MNHVKMTNEGKDEEEGGKVDVLSGNTAAVIHEVLHSMGRMEDFPMVKEILEKHMITSSDDVMVLTQQYCNSINLPWGFITAVKQKIRMQKVEMQDAWTIRAREAAKEMNRGVERVPSLTGHSRPASESGMSAPMSPTGRDAPLPPQIASDPRKLREHARRELSKMGRDPAEFDNLIGLIPRAEYERAELQ